MGEVYRATDTRLDRAVAIKVLPQRLASDPRFRERFDREARAISALDHPHICTLYDVGEHDGSSYLVMQYLEGETLAQRLERGIVPVREALALAVQMADALNKAHRAGLMHRDLKPGNIFLVRRGSGSSTPTAKLLDFGLAKITRNTESAGIQELSNAPTLSPPLTAEGTIVGTFQYMAPEQLEGRQTDGRTDIFAFGAVLYEMVTGRRAFEGRSQASLISAILKDDPPPPSSLQPLAPAMLDRVVTKCLAKDPDDRWQTARDLLDELRWVAAGSSQESVVSVPRAAITSAMAPAVVPRANARPYAWIAAVVLLAITLGLAATLYFRRPPEDIRVYRSTFIPPASLFGIAPGRLALSPDGRRLAFVAFGANNRSLLWVRALDSIEAHSLAGTDNAAAPFWSPDGRYLAFFADGKLKKIDASGGPAVTLSDSPLASLGAWNRDDVILFTPALGSPIFRVPAAGGAPTPATKLSEGELGHYGPQFLPDGRRFLFVGATSTQRQQAFVGSLDSSESSSIGIGDSAFIRYASGFLLFARGTTLMAQPFDASTGTLSGDAAPVAEQVQRDLQTNSFACTVSDNGTLAFQVGGGAGSRLVWFDRNGKRLEQLGDVAQYGSEVHLSPDGGRAAVVTAETGVARDVWIFDVKRGVRTKLTFDAADDREPIWSPDGKRIIFNSRRKDGRDLYQKDSSGAGEETVLLEDSFQKWPESVSADGRFLLYAILGPGPQESEDDLWVLPLMGDRKPYPYLQSRGVAELRSQFSPDGRWVAYASNETGQFEVYVRPFPGPGGKWLVSTSGGHDPRWRHDGKELFYVTDKQMMSVPVTASAASFDVGTVKALFDIPPLPTELGRAVFDVSPDGQRFLVNVTSEEREIAPITIVVNWPALLKK